MKRSIIAAWLFTACLGGVNPAQADGLGLLKHGAQQGLKSLVQIGKKSLAVTGKTVVMAAKLGTKAVAHHSATAARLATPARFAAPIAERIATPAIRTLGKAGTSAAAPAPAKALTKSGLASKLDEALTLVWKHKGAIALTAGLATFAANPTPFVNGATETTVGVGRVMMMPIADATRGAVEQAAPWVTVALAASVACGTVTLAIFIGKRVAAARPTPRAAPHL